MKRAVLSLVLICLTALAQAFGQSVEMKSADTKDCPFDIVGLWRSDRATETSRIFFSYSPDGAVTMLGHSPNTLPQDFEVITSVRYALDKRGAPKRIEFTAWRGNDIFQPGVTAWKIVSYGKDSFTTIDPATGQETRWVREQTHRYYLTLAARGQLAVAMWTALDGRKTEIQAIGAQQTIDEAGKTATVFRPIPPELYNPLIEESESKKRSNKDEIVVMRFELTRAEFESAQEIYQTWNERVKDRKLPNADPYLNVMELMREAVEGLNQCGEKAKLQRLTLRERGEILSRHRPPQQPIEYIKTLRKRNTELHVTDAMFPWVWRPLIQLPEH